jgi:hypothetical protein
MGTLNAAHLPRHDDADTIIITRTTSPNGNNKAAWEPIVDIQATSAQQAVQSDPVLPVFDLSLALAGRDVGLTEQNTFCEEVASCLQQTGCLIVKDPRVGTEQSDCFLDMMERYFSQPADCKMPDVYPELHYQVRICSIAPPGWAELA